MQKMQGLTGLDAEEGDGAGGGDLDCQSVREGRGKPTMQAIGGS